jgi:hypothetical protein
MGFARFVYFAVQFRMDKRRRRKVEGVKSQDGLNNLAANICGSLILTAKTRVISK